MKFHEIKVAQCFAPLGECALLATPWITGKCKPVVKDYNGSSLQQLTNTRKGIASQLVQHALNTAIEGGFDGLSLYCVEENAGAARLYRQYGFEIADRRPMPQHPRIKHGGDVLLMVRSTR